VTLDSKRSSSRISAQVAAAFQRRKTSQAPAMERNRLKRMKIAVQQWLSIMRAIFDGSDENIFKRNSQGDRSESLTEW
jgi:hypothetical protein